MTVNRSNYEKIINELKSSSTQLVAVSKIKPVSDIRALYDLGQRDFGENYVQELLEKAEALPKDIQWHFIGHLQSNKVKYIAPFVNLIHGVDKEKLLLEINKQGKKINRVIDCLLQVHIADEETKFGFDGDAVTQLVERINAGEVALSHVNIRGLMGMASFTNDESKIVSEFTMLSRLYKSLEPLLPNFNILSMGMSADYQLAIKHGSNMVRIGSLLFGARI